MLFLQNFNHEKEERPNDLQLRIKSTDPLDPKNLQLQYGYMDPKIQTLSTDLPHTILLENLPSFTQDNFDPKSKILLLKDLKNQQKNTQFILKITNTKNQQQQQQQQ